MFFEIPSLLDRAELDEVRKHLAGATFVDGQATAGPRARGVKKNAQLAADAPELQPLTQLVVRAISRSELFQAAALPRRMSPPMFNRYETGMEYGRHVDNPIMGKPSAIRTDISCTLFLSDPDEYDGGELVVLDGALSHRFKLRAGSLLAYPSTSLHSVERVTRGVRQAAIFWVQSLVREPAKRRLLFDLDVAVNGLTARNADAPELATLHACYANLHRMWSEL